MASNINIARVVGLCLMIDSCQLPLGESRLFTDKRCQLCHSLWACQRELDP